MGSSRARPLGVASTILSLAITTAIAASADDVSAAPRQPRSTCEDVHIFLARGWKEDYPGRQSVLVDAICAGEQGDQSHSRSRSRRSSSDSDSCGYEDVLFDDSASSSYGPAVYAGATAAIAQITEYAGACPDARIVLSGYSEGAHALGDALAGGGGNFFGLVEDEVAGIASDTTSPGNKSE